VSTAAAAVKPVLRTAILRAPDAAVPITVQTGSLGINVVESDNTYYQLAFHHFTGSSTAEQQAGAGMAAGAAALVEGMVLVRVNDEDMRGVVFDDIMVHLRVRPITVCFEHLPSSQGTGSKRESYEELLQQQLLLEQQEKARQEAETNARREAAERARRTAAERLEKEAADALARKNAEERARQEAELRARQEVEARVLQEAEAQARKEAERQQLEQAAQEAERQQLEQAAQAKQEARTRARDRREAAGMRAREDAALRDGQDERRRIHKTRREEEEEEVGESRLEAEAIKRRATDAKRWPKGRVPRGVEEVAQTELAEEAPIERDSAAACQESPPVPLLHTPPPKPPLRSERARVEAVEKIQAELAILQAEEEAEVREAEVRAHLQEQQSAETRILEHLATLLERPELARMAKSNLSCGICHVEFDLHELCDHINGVAQESKQKFKKPVASVGTSNIAKYSVGQKVASVGGHSKGYVLELVPATPGETEGPGLIRVGASPPDDSAEKGLVAELNAQTPVCLCCAMHGHCQECGKQIQPQKQPQPQGSLDSNSEPAKFTRDPKTGRIHCTHCNAAVLEAEHVLDEQQHSAEASKPTPSSTSPLPEKQRRRRKRNGLEFELPRRSAPTPPQQGGVQISF
jgi:hypothetical protein